MTTRILPREDAHKLRGTEAEAVIPHLETLKAQALVVEDGDRVVGCWLLMPVYHAECLWIAPEHRGKTSVARRLLRGLRSLAADLHLPSVWTAAMSDDVRGLLTTYGATKAPGDHYIMAMRG